jgi:putative iron-dependent peroxidase
VSTPQPGILAAPGPSGYCIELDFHAGDANAAIERVIAALPKERGIYGIGARFARKLGMSVPGLRELAPLSAKVSLAATPHDLFLFVSADSAGEAFDQADGLMSAARFDFQIAEHCATFRYRDGRDITGFVDGTENPVGEEARAAAIVRDGPLAGGSFAFVQRFHHDREKFEKLTPEAKNAVFGRSRIDNVELEDAPPTAHVKRVDQKAWDPPMTILRKSMPWGDVARSGLQFLAFTCDLERIDTLLARMVGAADEFSDSLLWYTRAETGAYYFCPPT